MRRRRVLALAAVALLAVTSGCLGAFSGSPIDEGALERDAEYDWETSATTTVRVSGSGEYHTLVRVSGQERVETHTWDTFGSEVPQSIAAVQFRYPNGTVVGAERIDVAAEGGRTVIGLPAGEGTLAYTATSRPKDISVPVAVEGSMRLVLPEGMRVQAFLFGTVRPPPTRTTVVDNRAEVYWERLPAGDFIDVRYYLERDFYLFTGLVAAMLVVALAGVVYFRLRIRRLEHQREEAGLGLDDENR